MKNEPREQDYLMKEAMRLVQHFWLNPQTEEEHITTVYNFLKDVCNTYAESVLQKHNEMLVRAKRNLKKIKSETAAAYIEKIEDIAIKNKKR